MQWQRILITFSSVCLQKHFHMDTVIHTYICVYAYLPQLSYSHMNVTYLWKCTSRFFCFFYLYGTVWNISVHVSGRKYRWSKVPLVESTYCKQQFSECLCNKATKHLYKCNLPLLNVQFLRAIFTSIVHVTNYCKEFKRRNK